MDRRNILHLSLLLPGLVLGGPTAAQSAEPGEQKQDAGLRYVEQHRIPPGISSELLAQGREIYADLKAAMVAARARDAISLRDDLRRARGRLEVLSTPPEQRALRAQMNVIRNDLAEKTKLPDASLWVPVEAELDRILVTAPTPRRVAATRAASRGHAAASRDDRETAANQLDVLTDALAYRFEAFPLGTVRSDIESALESANLTEPYWRGALEAVRSASAQLHWLSRVDAHGLLDAYYAVADSYVLWPRNKSAARDALKRAASTLCKTQGSERLCQQAGALAKSDQVEIADILTVLIKLKQHIDTRQQSERAAFVSPASPTQDNAPLTGQDG
jgi:hypothetical protein